MNVPASVMVVLQHDDDEDGMIVMKARLGRGDHLVAWAIRDARPGLWHAFVALDDNVSEHATFYVSGGGE